jgi:hypothetical protein
MKRPILNKATFKGGPLNGQVLQVAENEDVIFCVEVVSLEESDKPTSVEIKHAYERIKNHYFEYKGIVLRQ